MADKGELQTVLTRQDLEAMIGKELYFLEFSDTTIRGMEDLSTTISSKKSLAGETPSMEHTPYLGIGAIGILIKEGQGAIKIRQFSGVSNITFEDGRFFPRVVAPFRSYIVNLNAVRENPNGGYNLLGQIIPYCHCCPGKTQPLNPDVIISLTSDLFYRPETEFLPFTGIHDHGPMSEKRARQNY